MLWYCRYKWNHNTTLEEMGRRVLAQHEAGTNQQDKIRGWYDLAGGGAGFLLVETDDVRELTALLRPYMDLMAWDVRALSENHYDQTIQEIRDALSQMGRLTHADSSSHVGVES